MTTMRTKTIAGLAAFFGALLLAAMVSFAHQGPPPFGGHGGPGRPGPDGGLAIPFARDLNLSDAQKAQIKQITDSLAESTKAQHEQLRQLHDSAPDPLGSTFDEATVRAAAQARANVQVELEVAHARAMSQIYNVLTAEQKAQLAQRRQEFEQKHREREAQHDANPDGRP